MARKPRDANNTACNNFMRSQINLTKIEIIFDNMCNDLN
jgi:hypothetical protein